MPEASRASSRLSRRDLQFRPSSSCPSVPASLVPIELMRARDTSSERPFPACTRMSSSMPGTAETHAAIQPHSSAASAGSVRSAVLPAPRAPSKMPVRFGSPGPFRKASSMLSIALSQPAMTGGTRPDPGVKGLMRAATAFLFSANASLISFAILGKLDLPEISGNG